MIDPSVTIETSDPESQDPVSKRREVTLIIDRRTTFLLVRRVMFSVFIIGLMLLNYAVLHLFIAPLVWAMILAYLTWPIYKRVLQVFPDRPNVSALIMTIGLAGVFVWPFIWLIAVLQADLPIFFRTVGEYLSDPSNHVPEFLRRLPWLGGALQEFIDQLPEEPTALRAQLMEWATPWANEAAQVLGNMGLNMAKFALALLAVFFLYRDGEGLLGQTRLVLRRFLGKRGNAYLTAMAETSQAVLYGLILTALAQGLVAGIGYWVAGVPGSAMYGALTAIFALVPFGPPIIWVPISLWLLWNGHILAGIGLFIWGVVAISWIDNLVRPLVISSSTRIPFLLVIFSVLGGVAGFGLLGLFLGPIAVALLLAVWREWVGERSLPLLTKEGEINTNKA